MRRWQVCYLTAIIGVAGGLVGATALIGRPFVPSWVGVAWLVGLFVTALNLGYLMAVVVAAQLVKALILDEAQSPGTAQTAILYVVKNEGAELFDRMLASFGANPQIGHDLWLVSNSDTGPRLELERCMVSRLRRRFGGDRVFLFRPDRNPLGRKHVAVQEWAARYRQYQYFVVCDADTELEPGSVARLVAKAEHPANRRITLFQARLRISRSATRFARFLEPGQNSIQRIFSRVNFAVFGSCPYWGHAALIRREEFSKLHVPARVLSHDLWESAALDRADCKSAYCEDVVATEMFPGDFLEYRRRSKRWILGTLEAAPLLFSTRLSTGTRFYLSLALYTYLVEPVFIGWLLLGLLAGDQLGVAAAATSSLMLAGAPVVEFEVGSLCLLTIGFMWLYRPGLVRNGSDRILLAREVVTGTAVLLNSLFYDSLYVVASPWLSKDWQPMRKEAYNGLLFSACFLGMLPSTLFGVALAWAGIRFAPGWVLVASPIILSLLLGSVSVWWTSKSIPDGPQAQGQ